MPRSRRFCLALTVLLLVTTACGQAPIMAPTAQFTAAPATAIPTVSEPTAIGEARPIVLGSAEAPSEEQEHYLSTTVFLAPVGSGPGQLGLPVGQEGDPLYANKFVMDRTGNYYVLDRANKRVVEFDAQGKYLLDIPYGDEVLSAGDMAMDSDGQVYIFDTAGYDPTKPDLIMIKLFDRQGQLVREYPLPTWFCHSDIRAMRVDENGTLWIEGTQNGGWSGAPVIEGLPYQIVTLALGNSGEVFDRERQLASATAGLMSNTGNYISYSPFFGTNVTQYLYDSQGNRAYECRGCKGRFQMDRQGNMYMTYHELGAERYTVRKYAPDGKTLATMEMPVEPGVIDGEGAIYGLVRAGGVYEMVRWR